MTPKLHAELMALIADFFAKTIGDEEWALLQIHMAYCPECERMFRQAEAASDVVA